MRSANAICMTRISCVMKRNYKEMEHKEYNKKYSVFQNFKYWIGSTKKGYPKLLIFCALIVVVNTVVPVITTFLPKVVIEEITAQSPLLHVLTVTGIFTVSMAVLMGLQKYLEKYRNNTKE